jgi:hypothetical protein
VERPTYYALNDKCSQDGLKEITPGDAHVWNERGHGIFMAVNTFKGPRRNENCLRVDRWMVDLDNGSKADMWRSIDPRRNGHLYPSLVVETRKGFQVYFNAIDGRPENYRSIVKDRMLYYFNADPRAALITQLGRVPGFYHHKEEPYMVRTVFRDERIAYSEASMLKYFPLPAHLKGAQEKTQEAKKVFRKLHQSGDSLWDKLDSIGARASLERLSGSSWVNGEEFSFRPNANGNYNIWVNGKSTSCWIDKQDQIGSLNGGGPSIFQWLLYYGHSKTHAFAIIEQAFPEFFTETTNDITEHSQVS